MKPKKPVKSFKHKADKRAHIPSAEEAGYESGNPRAKAAAGAKDFPRNPVVHRGQDPELFWMHKYGEDDTEDQTAVDIRSLYRHEHIAPEQLIKGLYRFKADENAPQTELFSTPELFGNAIGHEELDKVSDYYTHSDGWSNRLIQGDSLLVMTSLLEREGMAGQVQCCYIDPPYGIKYGSNWQIHLHNRTITDGKDDHLSGEPEQIKAFRDTWELGINSYLSYLRDRLLVARELLHESGSCFVQISDENVHLVRCLMDEVFGSENFITTIVVQKKGHQKGDTLEPINDYLLWYARDKESVKVRQLFRQKLEYEAIEGRFNKIELSDGTVVNANTLSDAELNKCLKEGGRAFAADPLTSGGEFRTQIFEIEVQGQNFKPAANNSWKVNQKGMQRLIDSGRVIVGGKQVRFKKYLDDFGATALTNLWTDISGAAGKMYVVQTSEKPIQRCLLMTTDPGDLVLDPTCGSGTTAYVAEQWGRRWITTDTSRIALNIAKTRLMTASFPYYELHDQEGCDLRQGFIYKKVPHITLGSIANNEPPAEETLYDQPKEDKKRLRVAGPFTVETLQSYEPVSPEELARQREEDSELGNFEDLIFEHLKSAGVKTGDRSEAAAFTRIDRLSHAALHAEGWYAASAKGANHTRPGQRPGIPAAQDKSSAEGATQLPEEKKAYLHIGPKFGTVSKQAVTEAIKACRDRRDGDWLLILGFAFESGLHESSKDFGNFQVSLVRMHDDLLQTGLLKRDKKAASFVTIGEPDIRAASGLWLVTSDGEPLFSLDAFEVLSGIGGLEEINELGRDSLLKLKDLAERGNLRPDKPDAQGGGVRSGKHRGRSGKKRDGGVSAVSGDSQRQSGGAGDAAGTGPAAGVPDAGAIRREYEAMRRDQPDAFRAHQVAALEKIAASHWPLDTRHMAQAIVAGLDIYDPIRDEVKSRDVHDIAYWMLDDNYDGSNFVVRQTFFCGGDKKEFQQWKKGLNNLTQLGTKKKAEQTLKLEIDDEAFDRLYGHQSHPFPVKKGQKIAVRVLSQFGEETTKVLEVR